MHKDDNIELTFSATRKHELSHLVVSLTSRR